MAPEVEGVSELFVCGTKAILLKVYDLGVLAEVMTQSEVSCELDPYVGSLARPSQVHCEPE